MNRRGFLALPLTYCFAHAASFAQSSEISIVGQAGGFNVVAKFVRDGLIVYHLDINVVPSSAGQGYFHTTVLQRLQSAAVVEPNDPLNDFYPTIAQSPEGSGEQALIQIVTIRTLDHSLRIKGEFWFYVNGDYPLGPGVNAAQYPIKAYDSVRLTLAGGLPGRIYTKAHPWNPDGLFLRVSATFLLYLGQRRLAR